MTSWAAGSTAGNAATPSAWREWHRSAIDEIRVIGRFQLLERVGQGSFGAVWRARDTQLDRVVALKIPHEHALESAWTPNAWREARVAAQLRHPGIVRLYEIIALDDVPVLVSDFIDGMSLKAVLEIRRLTFRESPCSSHRSPRPWTTPMTMAWSIATSSRPIS